jgi:hypothetical protein
LYVKCLELRAEILGFNNVVSINLIWVRSTCQYDSLLYKSLHEFLSVPLLSVCLSAYLFIYLFLILIHYIKIICIQLIIMYIITIIGGDIESYYKTGIRSFRNRCITIWQISKRRILRGKQKKKKKDFFFQVV